MPTEIASPSRWHSLIQIVQQFALIDEERLQQAIASALETQQSLLHYLVIQQLVTAEQIAKAAGDYFGLPYIDLHDYAIASLPTALIDKTGLQQRAVLPISQEGQQLCVAVSDPENFLWLEELHFQTGLTIQAVMVADDQLRRLINQLLNEYHYSTVSHATDKNQLEDTAVIALVDRLISDAISQNASDIHCEPSQHGLRVRMRIDGVLREITQTPAHLANAVASRLKVMAELDIAERRLPQDGRFTFVASDSAINRDCRLNICPVLDGEKLVIRLLEPNKKLLTFDELGLLPPQQQIFQQAINKPQGLILVTGPTGSGKTLSLYTALAQLNRATHNIMTIEDPVEIRLPGINQVNVNAKAGLNFSLALRAFLRQDPDIIMVGEIRDPETASIAIRAAQTGHLVLSTLHTNSAAETITRLLNMGVAPYNVVSSLQLVIAQRLVRRLCAHCKQVDLCANPIPAELHTAEHFKKIFKAVGCRYCLDGYRGRIAIFELLPASDALMTAIIDHHSTNQLSELMQQQNLPVLWQSALTKVLQGLTSLAEIYRVIPQQPE